MAGRPKRRSRPPGIKPGNAVLTMYVRNDNVGGKIYSTEVILQSTKPLLALPAPAGVALNRSRRNLARQGFSLRTSSARAGREGLFGQAVWSVSVPTMLVPGRTLGDHVVLEGAREQLPARDCHTSDIKTEFETLLSSAYGFVPATWRPLPSFSLAVVRSISCSQSAASRVDPNSKAVLVGLHCPPRDLKQL